MKRSRACGFRALAAAVLGASFALAAAGAAAASPDPVALTPFVDCVSAAPGALPNAFTVVFGYANAAAGPLALAPGAPQNTFSLGGDRGQPTTFGPGAHHDAFATTFAGAAGDLRWTLGDITVAADATTPSCDTVTTVALAAPSTAVAGDAVAVSAVVGRMLLSAPTGGNVEFAIDSTVIATVPVNGDGVASARLDAPGAGDHDITARYVPPTATPQLLGSTATASLTVTVPSVISIAGDGLSADGRSARFIISRTATDAAASVDYVTADGSARAGHDYASSAGTVRFAVGQASATVAVPLLVRPFGSPGANFFVLLQRASDKVDVAGATAVLPQVTAIVTAGPSNGAAVLGFAQPQVPPAGTVAAPSSGGGRGAGGNPGDLALLFGGLLLTVGAASAVVGIMRFRAADASEL